MSKKSIKTPNGKLVEIDGITYQVIDGKLYRQKGTEIEDLYVKSELAKMTVEQRLKYEESIMTRNDILNSIAEQLEDARKEAARIGAAEGMAEGLEQGRAQGRAQGIEEGRAEGRAEGRMEGRMEGRAQGMAEGIAESKSEIARRMLVMEMPVEVIAKATTLTVEQIEALK